MARISRHWLIQVFAVRCSPLMALWCSRVLGMEGPQKSGMSLVASPRNCLKDPCSPLRILSLETSFQKFRKVLTIEFKGPCQACQDIPKKPQDVPKMVPSCLTIGGVDGQSELWRFDCWDHERGLCCFMVTRGTSTEPRWPRPKDVLMGAKLPCGASMGDTAITPSTSETEVNSSDPKLQTDLVLRNYLKDPCSPLRTFEGILPILWIHE